MLNLEEAKIVSISIDISSPPARVWDIITAKDYAKILGAVFDKNAFVESDWTSGAEVHFNYEPDRTVSTGIIGKLIVNELIQIDYDIPGMDYLERYSIAKDGANCKLSIYAGSYTSDFEAQKVVWKKWLEKVKMLSEK